MANNRSALLPVLRSETQARILAALLLHPEREASLTELAHETATDPGNVHGEVTRLLEAGILADRRVGRTRLVRAGESTLVRPLADLLLLAYGPKKLVEGALAGLPGVEEAYLYGSWAARYTGEPGPEPHDIDVLVIGNPDPDDLDDRIREAARPLGREVQAVIRSRTAWDRDGDGFLTTVRTRPLVHLDVAPPAAAR
jgi:predicted transcriptional regulator